MDPSEDQKKKPATKEERRALQEAQRKAKEEKRQQQPQQPQKPKPPKPQADGTQEPKPKGEQATATPPGQQSQPQVQTQPAQQVQSKPPPAAQKAQAKKPVRQFDDPKRAKDQKRQIVPLTLSKKQVPLFSHLPQYEKPTHLSLNLNTRFGEIHPAVFNLGLKYANGTIIGSNARCLAMLNTFKVVIMDYQTPPQKVFHIDFESKIKPLIQFLNDCRPKSIGMGNAINYFKVHIASTNNLSESEAKSYLYEKIDDFIRERIKVADQVISNFGVSNIKDGDVILTHACSQVVELTITKAFDQGKKFRVVVVDSRPKNEGKALYCRLVSHGVECTYVLINAISYILKEVTKVIVGAYALLSNGAVMSRVGTAVVAMMAHAFNRPVLVCCETYKFCERVQLDSICFNELGDAEELLTVTTASANANPNATKSDPAKTPIGTSSDGGVGSGVGVGESSKLLRLADWKENEKLKLLNLVYDVTPIDFITMVITEVGMIPPTSVPVVLREYKKEPF
eukprot:TRINITY_DN5099_c0_g6_i1.p1 TRINITY_DN5099_c0_g6~~TRINITY_DN5099_c0_g6_i1.p1  ORF type:complete len:532 (-),score=157.38 TRINITY_DN5099_c0_g6_i1:72-1601(-)